MIQQPGIGVMTGCLVMQWMAIFVPDEIRPTVPNAKKMSSKAIQLSK